MIVLKIIGFIILFYILGFFVTMFVSVFGKNIYLKFKEMNIERNTIPTVKLGRKKVEVKEKVFNKGLGVWEEV